MLKTFGVHFSKLCSILFFNFVGWLFLLLLFLLYTVVNLPSVSRELPPEILGSFWVLGAGPADISTVTDKQTGQGLGG